MVNLCIRIAGLAGLALFSTAAMSPGGKAPAAPNMAALRGLEKGQWELRERGTRRSETPRQRICVGDPAQLLHVQHKNGGCSRFVVSDTPNHAVVTYQCSDSGNGRTDLRVETPRLVQIDAQGISHGAPFALSLEARRTGDCP
ncbi:MAG: hypothetical protein R3E04_12535 [Sphingobium sp.]